MRRQTTRVYTQAMNIGATQKIRDFGVRLVLAHPHGLDPKVAPWGGAGLCFTWTYPYALDVWVIPGEEGRIEVTSSTVGYRLKSFTSPDEALDYILPALRLDAEALPR